MYPDGLGETVGRCMGVLYANYGMVVSRDLDWLQHAMNILVGIFRSYDLAANVSKSRIITCQPSALRAGILEEAMALKFTGVGYSYRVRLRRRIPCLECGVDLAADSIMAHRRRMYGTETVIELVVCRSAIRNTNPRYTM